MSLPLSSWQPLSHIHHDEAPRLHSRPYFQSLFCLSCAVQLITAAFKGGQDFVAFRPAKRWLRAAAVIFLLVPEKAGFERAERFLLPVHGGTQWMHSGGSRHNLVSQTVSQ